MSRWRRAANVDSAQKPICAVLQSIPGVSVALGHDDVLAGYQGRTYWFEIKSKRALRKDGTPRAGETRPAQQALLHGWRGHYAIISTVDEALRELGIDNGTSDKARQTCVEAPARPAKAQTGARVGSGMGGGARGRGGARA